MRRKFLSVVLCVCMMLTMAPFAFAEGGSSGGGGGSSSSVSATDTWSENKTGDLTITEDNAVIDGNAMTYTNGTITVSAANVTIQNLTFGDKAALVVNTAGKFTLTGCTFTPTTTYTKGSNNQTLTSVRTAVTLNVGEAVVTNNTFNGVASGYYNAIEFGIGTSNNDLSEATITGNTFNSPIQNNYFNFYNMTEGATIDIESNHFLLANKGSNAIRISNFRNVSGVTFNVNNNEYTYANDSDESQYEGFILLEDYSPEGDTVQDFSGITININNLTSPSNAKQLFYVYDDQDRIIARNQPIVKGDSSISKFCSARIGDTYYASLANAVADASTTNPDTIKLLKDTNESNIVLKKSGVLDLGGHTLDAGATNRWGLRVSNGIDVTIKNGTVKNAYSALSIWGSNDSNNPTKVTVAEDVTFTESGYGIIFTGYSQENDFTGKTGYAVLNFNGTITTEDGQCPIFVMGNLGDNDESATAIGENGNQIHIGATARITSKEESIVLNGMAKLSVVDGAVITGSDAITMKRGYLNITGGTFTGTGDKHIPTDAEHSGAEQSGSAITVSSTYNYSGLIDVKISGGTFNSTNSYGFYAGQSVENGASIAFTNTSFAISGGNFSGGEAAVYFADGKYISGGYFTSDPSAYCVDGKTGIPSTEPGYAFTVGEKTNTEVKPATGAPDVTVPDTIDNTKNNVAKAVGESVTDSTGALSAAANQAISNVTEAQKTDAENAIRAANSGVTVNAGDTVNIYAQTYLKVTPTAYEDNRFTLDIQPMYRVVASTKGDGKNFIFPATNVDNANAIVLTGSEKPLTNIQTMEISLELPTGFATAGSSVYVQHKGHEYIAAVTDKQISSQDTATTAKQIATFTNPDGFSEFTISKDPVAVATIGQNRYTTLQAAIDTVQDGQTIKLTKACAENVTVSRAVKFTLNKDGKGFTGSISAGSRYSVTSAVDSNDSNKTTYTVTYVGGGSSSGTPTTTYNVNVNAATNGAVAADKKTAAKGTTVTVTASPSKGYVVDAVKVVDKDGKDVAVTGKDGKYVFTMPGSAVTVTGTFKAETPAPVALPFTDVKSGNWFYDAVKYAYEQGLMTGTSATTFAPNETMNRAMIVTVLYRLEKSPAVTGASKFTDVPAGQWYSDAVAWAAANKIVNGYDETTFGPMNAVTREQMAAILFRYEQVKGLENVTLEENLNRFPDQNKISAYAIPALQWAVGQKIINGNADGTLDPTGTATRAQVAQIFTNLLNK